MTKVAVGRQKNEGKIWFPELSDKCMYMVTAEPILHCMYMYNQSLSLL